MKLVGIRLRNFRCYREEQYIALEDLTAIIGRNDVGKSAILDSIDGFFNETVEKSDLSTDAEDNEVEIRCYFENVPEEVVLDTSVASSPIEEGILNAKNQLEVKKVFTFGKQRSVAIYLIAYHPADPRLANLLSMKTTPLKAAAEEHGVDLAGVNKRKNPPMRAAIRNHIGGNREVRELKVDGKVDNEDNLKAVWSSLRKLLPVFSVFRSDKTFDDKDGDIKDPLQSAINEALALPDIRGLLEEIEEKVKQYSTDIADKTIEKLKEFDKDISERLKSEFTKDPSYGKVFDLTLLNENNIPLNKRGSGIRRLVVLSFFQAQAEKRKLEKGAPSIIYAIEEPETSQHPNHQTMIIEALTELSKREGVQVLFTTHSANLVREIPVESLRFISTDEENSLRIDYGVNAESGDVDESVISKIVSTLGILPNPSDRVKVLLFVEGNNDVNALKTYSQIISQDDPSFLNLVNIAEVGYVITGGSALKHYIEQKHLDGLGKPEIHIYDNDVEEYRVAVKRINTENNPRKIAFNTSKRELENYLHHDAIAEAYSQNGTEIQLTPVNDNADVPMDVAEAINRSSNNDWDELDEEKRGELSSARKKLLNTQAVEKMSVARLKERNGYDDLCHWLSEIARLSRM